MKKILLLLFAVNLISYNSTAQEITWISLEDAIELQKTSPRKIMIDIYTTWCGPCKLLDKNTFQNTDVANYVNENYYAVKFNGEGKDDVSYKGDVYSNPDYNPAKANGRNSPHELARYFRISAYPTIVFLDEVGEVITPLPGYQTPQQLEIHLKMFKKDDHLKIKTQEEYDAYYKSFEPEFKE